jgi:hypothetical protein
MQTMQEYAIYELFDTIWGHQIQCCSMLMRNLTEFYMIRNFLLYVLFDCINAVNEQFMKGDGQIPVLYKIGLQGSEGLNSLEKSVLDFAYVGIGLLAYI